MPNIPYPITADSAEELKSQLFEMLRQLFEDKIGGLDLGDIFINSGDILTLDIASAGGLEKSSNQLQVKTRTDGGINKASTGIGIVCKPSGGLATDSTGLYLSSTGGANFSTINCPAGTDPIAEIVGDTLNLAGTGLTITGDETTDTVTFSITDEAVANAKLAHMAVNTIKGRITAGTGDPEDLSAANVRTITGLATTDSPVFANVKLSGLTDGKISYHVNDSTGFADGPTKTDVDDAVTKKHAISDSMPWLIDIDVFNTATNTNWSTISINTARVYNGGKLSSGAQNDLISWPVVLAAGTWTFSLIHTKDTYMGVYSVQIDDSEKGTIDGYAAATAVNTVSTIAGITVAATAKVTLKIKMTTKHASSSDYYGLIHHVRMTRTA